MQLYAYAHALVVGETPDPALAAHLAACPACREALADLLAVMRAAIDPGTQPAPALPGLDLSRLQRPPIEAAQPASPWAVDRMGRLWLELSDQLLRAWQPAPLLGAQRGALLYSFERPARPPEPGVLVAIYEEDVALAQLAVNVELADGDPLDQSGVPVALYVGEAVREAATDSAGSVQFARVPRSELGRLRLAVTFARPA